LIFQTMLKIAQFGQRNTRGFRGIYIYIYIHLNNLKASRFKFSPKLHFLFLTLETWKDWQKLDFQS
jgi:hypothetical protein